MRRAESGALSGRRATHFLRAYLHVAASMTGNLGKFSTEPAADGWRDKDEKARERERERDERAKEREIQREREKARRGDKRREVDVGRVHGRAQTTRHGCSRATGARQQKKDGLPDCNRCGERGGAGGDGTGWAGKTGAEVPPVQRRQRGRWWRQRRRIILVICSEGEISKAVFFFFY